MPPATEFKQGGALSPASREFGQGGIPANENVQPGDVDYTDYINKPDWRPLNSYMETYEVWKCPSDRGKVIHPTYNPSGANTMPIKPTTWSVPAAGSSFMFNTWGITEKMDTSGVVNPNPTVDSRADRIKVPGNFVLFHEPALLDVNCDVGVYSGMFVYTAGYGAAGAWNFHLPYFEDAIADAVFADGHARKLANFTGLGTQTTEFKLIADWLR